MLNLMIPVVADYWIMHGQPLILEAFVISPKSAFQWGPSHIWILVCIVHVWISVCGHGGRIDGPREVGRGAPTARVGTVGIGSGPVVTSSIKKPREEDSLTRRDRAPQMELWCRKLRKCAQQDVFVASVSRGTLGHCP
jgi:hypothetical protein